MLRNGCASYGDAANEPLPWANFQEAARAKLPPVEIVHPGPDERFAAKHQVSNRVR